MNAIEALSFTLTQWVNMAFPSPQRDSVTLNSLWMMLAHSLCGSQVEKEKLFMREIAQLRPTSNAGLPPTHALEQRLYELIEAGMRDLFIVIAVRQSMEQLIPIHFSDTPHALNEWKRLADTTLPLKIQFAIHPNEISSPYRILHAN